MQPKRNASNWGQSAFVSPCQVFHQRCHWTLDTARGRRRSETRVPWPCHLLSCQMCSPMSHSRNMVYSLDAPSSRLSTGPLLQQLRHTRTHTRSTVHDPQFHRTNLLKRIHSHSILPPLNTAATFVVVKRNQEMFTKYYSLATRRRVHDNDSSSHLSLSNRSMYVAVYIVGDGL